MRDGNDIAGLENDVVGSVAAFHQFVQVDGDRIVQVRRINWRGGIRGGIGARSSRGRGLLRRTLMGRCFGGSGESRIFRADRWRLRWIGRRFVCGPVHDHGVAGVIRNAPGLCQNFQKSHGPVGLVNHGMSNRPNYGDGLALSLLNGEANFGLVSHAEVSLTVKERKSKPITVVGAVGHAMVYQADRPVTLLEVLAEAGGVANDAGDTVIVNRPAHEAPSDPSEPPAIGPEDPALATASKAPAHEGSPQQTASSTAAGSNASANPPAPIDPPHLNNTITINLNELMESGDATNNIILQAGDIVTVPHSGIVYVLGAVSKPGGFVLANDRGQLTTLKILALAGGLSRT